ncbi:pleiotropic drug resistance ABC transporter [Infundibulicybe gibba]|nr:pleiotropic drug resistance ABC transporter [Infundibulicybe gibba]
MSETPLSYDTRAGSASSGSLRDLPTKQAIAAHDISSDNRPTTTPNNRSRARSGSTVSHVDVDFFDPSGVQELQRQLTRKSTRGKDVIPPHLTHSHSDSTLTGDSNFNLERVARLMVEDREKAQIKTRELGVVFEDLHVTGLGASASYQPTLGSTVNPMNLVKAVSDARHPPLRSILAGFEGVVRPGEMLLVLGRPGSGCSTFLKTLANQTAEYYSVTGDINYDSLSPAEIAKHYRGDVQYCPEDDVHFPTLTVQQTLDFAAKTRAPQSRLWKTRREYISRATQILTTVFGLKHAMKTPVGDAAIRGVSGGEKKRVSIAEALATRSRVNAWDNSTRGLDSSTALEFGRALRIATDLDRVTTIVSIYQAGESLYQLFDKVCVIYEGKMAYFGPADQARQYFIDLGYEPANRQTTPDFLVAVTDPNGRIPRSGLSSIPRDAEEFARHFLRSPLAQVNKDDIMSYKNDYVGVPDRAIAFRESAVAEHSRNTRKKSPYTISVPMQARAVMLRRVQILLGDKTTTLSVVFSFIIQGVIVGTVFLKVPETTSAFFSRGGLLFFALLFSALSSMAEIPALYKQRPIVLRHQKAAMYHPFTEALALTVVDMPITFFTTAVFGILIYFLVGLQQSAAQFFIFFLFLFVMSVTMKAWFRAIASAFKSEASAQAFSGIMLLILVIYTGYTIPKTTMIGALRWLTYINPLRYGFESVIANEFHTLHGTCSSLVPQGPGYENVSISNQVCAAVGAVAGEDFVDGNRFIKLNYDYSYSNLWMQARMTDIFSWQHIHYTVPVPGGERQLLDDVSGYVAPGRLTALMGESGAGKTTLLNVLAQRVGTGVVSGDRFVNGQPLPYDFQAQSGYCQQMDTHVPTDTVREALLFSAKMRQPESVPLAEKEAYVDTCLKMCGLEAYADAVVGSLGVEHRKRTTIGVELAAKPKLLLFLDEPTSGLDSQSAWGIMSFLRSLADNGQAILCTIHQPSAELFQVFDRLLLLRKGGQTVYFGDLGKNSNTLIQYFERNGSRHCDGSENPAEFMLDVIGAGATATSAQDWHSIWRESNEAREVQNSIDDIHAQGRQRPPVATTIHSEFATSWFHQVKLLSRRQASFHWRDPTYLMAKLVLNIFAGLFIGFTFFKANNSQQGIQNQVFAVYMATILAAPLANQLQVPFLNMRNIYEIRERPSRMYSWSTLVTAQISMELPWNILGSSLFFLCWFWTVGFDNSRAGYTYLMLGVVFPLYYTTFAQGVASMAPNAEMAAILYSLLFSFVITFNGVLQPFRQLGWWQWMYHVSPFTYFIEAVGNQSLVCSAVELVPVNPPSGQTCAQYLGPFMNSVGGYVTNPSATNACEFCSFATADQFLGSSFNIFYSHRWRDVGITLAYAVLNIFLIYAFTYFFRIRTRHITQSIKKRLGKD